MGGMMGTAGALGTWVTLGIVLGVALITLAVAVGISAGRALSHRYREASREIRDTPPAGMQEAQATLRLRYARGEDHQGRVPAGQGRTGGLTTTSWWAWNTVIGHRRSGQPRALAHHLDGTPWSSVLSWR